MPTAFSSQELELALKRVERDHEYSRVFVTRDVEWIIVRQDRVGWLSRLEAQLASGSYSASAAEIVDVPKAGGTVRAGSLLSLVDEVVYTTAVGRCLPAVVQALGWQNPHPDCSYRLRRASEADWLSSPFACWKQFRERSMALIDPSVNYVVCTDVVTFYDSVLHKELLSDLLEAGEDEPLSKFLIGDLLGRWSLTNGRGIPQGLSASDVLAKLYLNRVDRMATQAGVTHLRYVDDIRIFCASLADARRALLELQRLLRGRGLAIQSSKTSLLRADEARVQFDGIQPVLLPIARKFSASIAAAAGLDTDYMSPSEIASALVGLDSPPTELLRQTYRAYFIDEPRRKFEKTLFHFVLGRLGMARDAFAASHAVSLLAEHPQESAYVLKYLAQANVVSEHEAQILELLSADEAVYPFQHYQFLRWRSRQSAPASDALLAYARRVQKNVRAPQYLVGAARLLLSRFGTVADLDVMTGEYAAAQSDMARLDIACAVHRMEKTKRNAFLGRVSRDGPLLSVAVEAIKSGAFEAAVTAL
jgi:Reverse transcriptase (RNA-dependent DNA polymerase)